VTDILNFSPSLINEIYLLNTDSSKKFSDIVKSATEKNIKISYIEKRDLDRVSTNSNHQGIAANIKEFEYVDFQELIEIKNNRFYLVLDHIEDPHNLGAIIRTANFFGVDGIVLPKDRAAAVTPTVIKTSSGAAATIPISRVSNLGNAIKELKKKNFWVVGADTSAKKTVYDSRVGDLDIALVIGSEGKGISRKIKEQCDFLFSIPKLGNVDSLNASVASGVMIYELKKQQGEN
ncbi:MAG: 23S rRNA (guanosine(2251)-2'-O)-methyltransferase RlmB, partial [Thermodesulfobacteriota bacterium]